MIAFGRDTDVVKQIEDNEEYGYIYVGCKEGLEALWMQGSGHVQVGSQTGASSNGQRVEGLGIVGASIHHRELE